MNCFVIMPFAPEFDDVYAVIKSSVESVGPEGARRCFRLDESRPAGRITDRLLAELRSASLCVADLTGTTPNVMWEIGFAMALAKPTIVVTQDANGLPFDLKDMQSIQYDRNRLSATLAGPLRRSILDTIGSLNATVRTAPSFAGPSAEAFGALLTEVAQLKEMVSEVVRTWKSDASDDKQDRSEAGQLVGNWISKQSGGHLYSRIVRGELVTPYCYGSDNDLTGVYYDWRRIGEYWFARYKWLGDEASGFTFLRQQSADTLTGAWWEANYEPRAMDVPPKHAGISSTWMRQAFSSPPAWAQSLLDAVAGDGLDAVLARAA